MCPWSSTPTPTQKVQVNKKIQHENNFSWKCCRMWRGAPFPALCLSKTSPVPGRERKGGPLDTYHLECNSVCLLKPRSLQQGPQERAGLPFWSLLNPLLECCVWAWPIVTTLTERQHGSWLGSGQPTCHVSHLVKWMFSFPLFPQDFIMAVS